jgi:hypothetical protein
MTKDSMSKLFKTYTAYLVKVPTRAHRLNKSGTILLNQEDAFKLYTKKGILFVDMTKRVLVKIPKELLEDGFQGFSSYMGDDKAFGQYSIKSIIEKHNLKLEPLTEV